MGIAREDCLVFFFVGLVVKGNDYGPLSYFSYLWYWEEQRGGVCFKVIIFGSNLNHKRAGGEILIGKGRKVPVIYYCCIKSTL